MIFFDWTAEELRKQADLEDEKEGNYIIDSRLFLG